MKKIATLLCFSLFVLAAVSAQSSDGTGFRFGVHVSPTLSWMSTSDKKIENVGNNLGLKLGVQGEIYFAPNYAIVTGLGFGFNHGGTLQNGYPEGVFWAKSDLSDRRFDTLSMNAKLHYRVTYVEIPFGLKLRGGSNEDSPLKYYAEIPVFTLGFVTKSLGDIRGTNDQNTEDEDIRKSVNGLSLSWGLGAGIEYELATSATLVAGLSFQKQFTDLTDDGGSVLKNNAYVKENSKGNFGALTLKIGVFF